jgi:hypothetical protein
MAAAILLRTVRFTSIATGRSVARIATTRVVVLGAVIIGIIVGSVAVGV